MKKICSLLTAIVLLVSALVSCRDNKSPTDTVNTDTDTVLTTDTDTAETTEIKADVPKVNMDGLSFTFLSANWDSVEYQTHEIFTEGYNNNALNDAIYDRNLYMEDTYNCEIVVIPAQNPTVGHSMLEESVLSDDKNMYDFYLDKLNRFSEIARNGYLLNLDELPYVNFNNSWWDTNSYEDLSLFGYHFAVCSDITLVDKDYTSLLAFNTEMFRDLYPGQDLPYELVRSGEWTVEALMNLAKGARSADMNNSRYGLAIFRDSLMTFMVGGGNTIGAKNENDEPYVSLQDVNVMNYSMRLMEYFYDKDTVYNLHAHDEGSVELSNMFQNNKFLFTYARGNEIEWFRTSMESDFGLLPTPKASEEQKEYYTDVNPWGGVCLVMPINSAEDLTNYGIFLEDYAFQGNKTVMPAYYDILLDYRWSRDTDSAEMLKIVYKNRCYDVGAISNWANYGYEYIALTTSYDLNLASFISSKLGQIDREIQYLKEKIEKNYN